MIVTHFNDRIEVDFTKPGRLIDYVWVGLEQDYLKEIGAWNNEEVGKLIIKKTKWT